MRSRIKDASSPFPQAFSRRAVFILAAALLLGVGLTLLPGSRLQAQPETSAPDATAGPQVEVEVIRSQQVRFWHEYSGRLAAVERVELRPRVSGTIVEVRLEDGAQVEAGELLYVIDPRPFEAEVANAKAELEAALSRVELTKAEIGRAQELIDKKLVSQSHYDIAQNDYRVALAAVSAARARLQRAELDVDYAHIKAPVSGRVSRAEITKGNVVEAGANAPVLTTIVSSDRLYAEFDLDEATYLQLIRDAAQPEGMPVEMRLSDAQAGLYRGRIHAFDNQLNIATGTIRARAVFENKDGLLIPGMFANLSVSSDAMQDVLLVPERAIGTNQSKKFVYVVTPENRVAYREVRLGSAINGSRVILEGLQVGEKVMVNSLQRVQPDMQVAPVVIKGDAAPGADDLTATN